MRKLFSVLRNTDATDASGATGDSPTPTGVTESASPALGKDDNKSLAELVKEKFLPTAADSSTAQDGEGDKTLEGEVKEDTAPKDDETPIDETDKTKEVEDDEQPAPEADKPGDEKLPFNAHPRFKELVTEKNTLKQELEDVKPLAEAQNTLLQYCETNGISNEDFQEALTLAALVKKDPKQAVEKLSKLVELMSVQQGTRLPADLQKKVDDGHIGAEEATELARLRIEKEQLQQQRQTQQQRAQQQTEQAVVKALGTWEQTQLKSNPDWKTIQPFVADRYTSLLARSQVRSVEDAVALAEQALQQVRKQFPRSKTSKPTKAPLTQTSSSVNKGPAATEMKSWDDFPKLARQRVAEKFR